MSVSTEPTWIEPYQGYEYMPRQITLDAADQAQKLAWCGVDPGTFGEEYDPAAFITMAIREGVRNGIHSRGAVNLGNRIIQHRTLRLGELLNVAGKILTVDEVPRGRIVTSETWLGGSDGQRALVSHRKSLRPAPTNAGVRGGSEPPAPFIEDVARSTVLATFTFLPEHVKAYAGPNNPIHFDSEAAKRAGYSAPIIGGGQGVHLLTAEIWRRFRPQVVDFEVRFRRPIYWDDQVNVVVEERDGAWHAMGLMTQNNKVATEVRIHRIG